jgi:hypothetical protein
MWTTIVGALVGGGAGFGIYYASQRVGEACFTKEAKLTDLPVGTPADVVGQIVEDNSVENDRADAACDAKSPVTSWLVHHQALTVGGMVVLGGLTGFLLGRK